jgi:hypothetical protein
MVQIRVSIQKASIEITLDESDTVCIDSGLLSEVFFLGS